MEDVIELAKRLAHLLAHHERTTTLRTAAAAVEADAEASRVQRAYAEAIEVVREREVSGKPIEPEQKRAILTAAESVRASPVLLQMLEAHAAYSEMMETVQAILSGFSGVENPEGEAEHQHGPDCNHGEPEPPAKSVLWTP